MNFVAVIFDCDGVLVDSEVLAIKGERGALESFGLRYSPAEYVGRFVGLHDDAFFEALRNDFQLAFKTEAPDDFEDRILEGRSQEKHALQVIAGAAAAMGAAKTRFGAIAVASSSRAHFLKSKLERTGLYGLAAPHVYSADLVANGKPSPDIFLFAAERLGVDPARCLVLEDSENGVRAGCAAGMSVWGFLGGGHCFEGHESRLRKAGARQTVCSFAEFNAQIDGAASGAP
ncbi:HAD family hydrolase [Hyphococcus sp.]|uniref:HAD family hydrolase n=1 Tax=Hyphococcus sp. TaxID=2038636 RepID=UPI003CCBAF17